jgi:magnesium-transporting ATPase (P-type)
MIEFDSARKRMTSVVKSPEGKIIVMTKGADSIILPLLKAKQPNADIVE